MIPQSCRAEKARVAYLALYRLKRRARVYPRATLSSPVTVPVRLQKAKAMTMGA